MTLHSMTGFASGQGAEGAYTWVWEIRSVNAKGLDVRARVPDWLEGLENEIKTRASNKLGRGNVTVGLRLSRAEDGKGQMQINTAAMETMLAAIAATQAQAAQVGLQLAPVRATDILQMRGVLEQATAEQDSEQLVQRLLSEFDSLLADFVNMRAAEGAALLAVLTSQIDRIDALRAEAAQRADDRQAQIAETLKSNLARVLSNSEGADPDRVAQELALIAVKADVTEELDRLAAHVAAARKLIGQGGPVGRKLDFLMQEFNREANTLCSKAQNAALTEVGLELKTVIDQMREQVQNIE
ncbi:YicC/YloC family endoribonuclease [Epibacterium sp. Ofav1-8]|uniref:YicC/YloC family endoribonuclease n=1 Tax=Epibacterium sp. Ofav1-8 TaxID=2917735 RepID=UPI001EF55EEE|nr:YicC/YloC family endoribonuclease [Epibacterium sp. Ofav1-8]MCG7622703.1 YicC family protein [Epibacterium sp. Ofav1-8]